jgi:hypothetical protein
MPGKRLMQSEGIVPGGLAAAVSEPKICCRSPFAGSHVSERAWSPGGSAAAGK